MDNAPETNTHAAAKVGECLYIHPLGDAQVDWVLPNKVVVTAVNETDKIDSNGNTIYIQRWKAPAGNDGAALRALSLRSGYLYTTGTYYNQEEYDAKLAAYNAYVPGDTDDGHGGRRRPVVAQPAAPTTDAGGGDVGTERGEETTAETGAAAAAGVEGAENQDGAAAALGAAEHQQRFEIGTMVREFFNSGKETGWYKGTVRDGLRPCGQHVHGEVRGR